MKPNKKKSEAKLSFDDGKSRNNKPTQRSGGVVAFSSFVGQELDSCIVKLVGNPNQ